MGLMEPHKRNSFVDLHKYFNYVIFERDIFLQRTSCIYQRIEYKIWVLDIDDKVSMQYKCKTLYSCFTHDILL